MHQEQQQPRLTMSTSSEAGYLELFIGPMFSGKTSKLLELHKQYTFCGIPTVVINHLSDTRYHASLLSTHDKQMIPCVQTNDLVGLLPTIVDTADVFLVNEGQFFHDLVDFVEALLSKRKKVVVAGLDGDFQRRRFGPMLDLIPICDKVTKLNAFCSVCKDGTPGIFSKRTTMETQQLLVGSDNYTAVCRACYEGDHKKSGEIDR
jgi:thymidine kinase